MKVARILPLFALIATSALAEPAFQSAFTLAPDLPEKQLPEFYMQRVTLFRHNRSLSTPDERSQVDGMADSYIKAMFPSGDTRALCGKAMSDAIRDFHAKTAERETLIKKALESFTDTDFQQQLAVLRSRRSAALQAMKDPSSDLGRVLRRYHDTIKTFPPDAFALGFGGPRVIRDGKTAMQIVAPLHEEIANELTKLSPPLATGQVIKFFSLETESSETIQVCTRRPQAEYCSMTNLASDLQESGTEREPLIRDALREKLYLPTLEDLFSSATIEACLQYDVVHGENAPPAHAATQRRSIPSKDSVDPSKSAAPSAGQATGAQQ